MPRLRQVSRKQATESVRKAYARIFGDRDPTTEPGTSTGTPGNWWTVMALSPYVFGHATFALPPDQATVKLDDHLRELALMRVGYTRASRFVYSQHCKAARHLGVTEEKIAAVPYWHVSDVFDARERAVLAWTDDLILQDGRISDAVFEALHTHLDDAEILELTYRALTYNLHALTCKALRLEYDDVDDRITEIPAPEGGGVASWR